MKETTRKQIRFNNIELKQLELFIAKVKVKNDSEAMHLAIEYALKYFDFVTKALETTNFEVALLRRTKYYGSETDTSYKKF